MKLCQERCRVGYLKKRLFPPEGSWELEQPPQESGHYTGLPELKKCLDNAFQAQDVTYDCPVQGQKSDSMILVSSF